MASLSTIHAALIAQIATLYPHKTQLNANDLEDNPHQFMIDGWGIKVGGGSPIEQDIVANDYTFATDRAFSIVLTREVYDLQANLASYNTNVGLIGDDKDSLIESLLDFSKVEGMKGGEEIDYIGDGGIEFMAAGKKRFIFMEIAFSFDLTQLINQ